MTLQDSPSLNDFADGYRPPPDPAKVKKRVRIILGIVGLLLLVWAGNTFANSDLAVSLARKGSVTGSAVDEAGNPIQVEVLVFGTNINVESDNNGFFEMEKVPAGEQSIIVAYGVIATEVALTVDPGVGNSLGTVTVPTELAAFTDEQDNPE